MKKFFLFLIVLSFISCQNNFYKNNIKLYDTNKYPKHETAYFVKNQDTLRLALAGDYRRDYKIAKRIKKDFNNQVIYFKNKDIRKILHRNGIGKPNEQFLFFFTSDYVHINGLGFYYDKPFPKAQLKASSDSISVREDGHVTSLFYPYKNQYVVDNFIPMKDGFARVILLDKPNYNEKQTDGFLNEANHFIYINFRDTNFKYKSYNPFIK